MANLTSSQEYRGWVAPPSGRGTINIIWSCLSVLLICCWSVIHPNVPRYNDSSRRILWRKIAYASLCLVVPELLIWHAGDDWLTMRYNFKEMREIFETEKAKEESSRFVSDTRGHSKSRVAS